MDDYRDDQSPVDVDGEGTEASFHAGAVLAHRPIVREIAARGHEVGSHSWSHPENVRALPRARRRSPRSSRATPRSPTPSARGRSASGRRPATSTGRAPSVQRRERTERERDHDPDAGRHVRREPATPRARGRTTAAALEVDTVARRVVPSCAGRAMNLYVARYVDRWVGLPLCFALHVLGRLLGGRLAPMGATTPPGPVPLPRPRRVLGMKFYGLGNIVMILPVLRELRAAFPDVRIEFLTLPGNAALLEESGLVDRVHGLDVSSVPRFVASVVRLLGALRRSRYDTVLDFEQFMRVSGIFAFLTGAPERIGLDTEGQRRGWLYTTRVSYTDGDHTVDVFLRMIAPFGARPADGSPWRLALTPADREAARALVAEAGGSGPLVVVHPGTGPNYKVFALKRWETARFAAVADALAARHGATIVFTGKGPEERALVAEARAAMSRPGLDACDRLDVGGLAALCAAARVVLTNDTAVMHLAGTVGTPVAALFGPTPPSSYGPRGPDDLVFYKHLYCSPCLSNYNLKMSRCTDNVCLKAITADEVLAAIEARWFRDAAPTRAAGG